MGILLNKSKNYIINGAMDFFQRQPTGTVNISTSQVYRAADRFLTYYAGTVTGTPYTGRNSNVPTSEFTLSCAIAGQRNAGTFQAVWYQRIESSIIKGLSNKNVCMSCWILPEVSGTVKFLLSSYATADAGGTGTTIVEQTAVNTTAGVWQRIEFTTTLPDVSNGLGVYVIHLTPSGTDASPKAYSMTGLQLEEGVSASNFERAGGNIAGELQLCQKYYEKSYNLDVAPGSVSSATEISDRATAAGTSTYGLQFAVKYKIPKRVSVTPTVYSSDGTSGVCRNFTGSTNAAMTSEGQTTNGFCLRTNSAPVDNSAYGAHWTADAEI